MAKRFSILKEFGRTTKKPKLDITINSVNSERSSKPSPIVSNPGTSKRQSPVKSISPSKNDLWDDDDDDDVILLATQVAESQVASTNGVPRASIAATAGIADTEITFSEFAPHVKAHGATSTQWPTMNPINSNDNMLSEMFDCDDDFDLMSAVSNEHKKNTVAKENDVFKKPSAKLPTQFVPLQEVIIAEAEDINGAHMQFDCEVATTQTSTRRQLASERQIKFLMDRVDLLKKENAKLSHIVEEAKTKVNSKDGEANLLRDELRHMKQQIQQLKMQKLYTAEAVEMKCKTKIAEMNKQMEATQTELQFKVVECKKLRQADEAKRLELSIRDNSIVGKPKPFAPNKSISRTMLRLRSLSLTNLESNSQKSSLESCTSLYEPSVERGISKRQQRTLFQMELENIQTIIAQLQLQSSEHIPEQEAISYVDRIMNSVYKVFPEFWSYVHSLEFPKNCRVHPYHDYSLMDDASERTTDSLHQSHELYNEERALSLRRYIACLAIICRSKQLPQLFDALLSRQHGEYLLLRICVDAVSKLGFSREVCDHFGLIEALSTFLHGLLQSAPNELSQAQAELIFDFLKQIVFVRPTPWIFAPVSFCVLECMRMPRVVSLLCCNSGSKTFVTDRVRSIYHFTNDSCMLQVYAGLLEIAFPMNGVLHAKHFDLLTVICSNHVRFVYYCFADPPQFIHSNLPSYDEDDEDDNVELPNSTNSCNILPTGSSINGNYKLNSTNSCSSDTVNSTSALAGSISNGIGSSSVNAAITKCECYTKLCLSVVTLVFQLLRQWTNFEKCEKNDEVSEISRVAVQLLHIIFCDNYVTSLFRDEEETTKHHLCMIYKYWSENMDLLEFSQMHRNILAKLQSSHIMPKQLNEEEKVANIGADLKEWHRLTNDESTSENSVELTEHLELKNGARDPEPFFEGLKGYAFNFQ